MPLGAIVFSSARYEEGADVVSLLRSNRSACFLLNVLLGISGCVEARQGGEEVGNLCDVFLAVSRDFCDARKKRRVRLGGEDGRGCDQGWRE